MEIKVKKIHSDAKVPTYSHSGDAGMDLYALEDMMVAPGHTAKIRTGVAMEIPFGCVGLIWDKSSIGINHSLKTLGGVIDAGYRGEVMIGLINLGKTEYTFKKHDKVCQMLIQPVAAGVISEADELSDTSRGQGALEARADNRVWIEVR